jgi:hypothetical protein
LEEEDRRRVVVVLLLGNLVPATAAMIGRREAEKKICET